MASFIEPYALSVHELDCIERSQDRLPSVMPRATDEVLSPETKLVTQAEGRAAFAAHYAETGRIWAEMPLNPYGPTNEWISNGRHGYRLDHTRAKQWAEGYGCAQSEEGSGMGAILRAERVQEPQENQ